MSSRHAQNKPQYAGGRMLGTVGIDERVQQTAAKFTGYSAKRAKRRVRNNPLITAATTNIVFRHRRFYTTDAHS